MVDRRLAAFALAALAARPAGAWGKLGHQLVVEGAARALAPPLADLARRNLGRLKSRSMDPDFIWRDECGRAEAVQHFFDADAYPVALGELPHDLDALRARFGAAAV